MEKEKLVRKRPDPLLLEKLELLQEMEKLEMVRDLRLLDDSPRPKTAPKVKEKQDERKI